MRFLFLLSLAFLAACGRPDLPLSQASEARTRNVAPPARQDVASNAVAPAQPAPRAAIPPPEATSDAAISTRIGGELAKDPGMAGADVSVHTDRGVVTLSGTVKSQEQTGIASAHAQRQDGVMRVDNHLRPALS